MLVISPKDWILHSILQPVSVVKCVFASVFSVNSTSSACSTKYDPDLLKADVALARTRVARLKRELEQIRTEMKYQEQGVKTLAE